MSLTVAPVEMTAAETQFIQSAAAYLEQPSFLLRVANLVGKPIESLGGFLPAPVRRTASGIVDGALQRAAGIAFRTLPKPAKDARVPDFANLPASRWRGNLGPAITGAMSGFFGLPALAVELPLTTTLMLRGIAAEAARMGEDLSAPDMRWQCLSVFHLAGAGSKADAELSAMESSYYAARVSLAGMTREAVRYAAAITAEQLAQDLATGASPVLVRLLSTVASRFQVVVSQKLLLQAAPAVGAVGGALVNSAFSDHFQRVAQFHFGLRALERLHGRQAVQDAYQAALAHQKPDEPPGS
ncbi:MAG: EcsC family protein [Pirellulales bacterium]